jgi:phage virion morphogenesis protein
VAGARIEVDISAPSLARAARELSSADRRKLLEDIGEYLLRSTRDRAAREIDPDGTPWRALSPRYKRFKDKKRPGLPKLKFDHHMLGDRLASQVEGDAVLVGTSAKYGALHQFGGEVTMPARQAEVFFKRDRDGQVGNAFMPKRRANFAQSVMVPAYKVVMPARPWLGLSPADEDEIAAIAQQHLDALLAPREE